MSKSVQAQLITSSSASFRKSAARSLARVQVAHPATPGANLLCRYQGHNFAVTGVSWYPNDTGLFVSGGFDKAVKAWDTNRAEVAFTFPMPDKVHCVQMPAVAHRHNLIAVGSADR
eukprot:1916409-Rhodomonas_salina.1